MRHLFAITVIAVAAILLAPATDVRADDSWKPQFAATDKQAQWQEVMDLATRAFAAKRAEAGAAAPADAQENRMLLFYRTACLVNLWRTLYLQDGAIHPTDDYVFVVFSEGLYYEYANNMSGAATWFAATDKALKMLPPGDMPVYDGQPIAQLVKDREAEVVAITAPLQHGTGAPHPGGAVTPPGIIVIPSIHLNGYNVDSLSSAARQQQWMALTAKDPKLFAPTASDIAKLNLDAHSAVALGGH